MHTLYNEKKKLDAYAKKEKYCRFVNKFQKTNYGKQSQFRLLFLRSNHKKFGENVEKFG